MNRQSGDVNIVDVAPGDETRIYVFKLTRHFEKFFRENSYRHDGIITWN